MLAHRKKLDKARDFMSRWLLLKRCHVLVMLSIHNIQCHIRLYSLFFTAGNLNIEPFHIREFGRTAGKWNALQLLLLKSLTVNQSQFAAPLFVSHCLCWAMRRWTEYPAISTMTFTHVVSFQWLWRAAVVGQELCHFLSQAEKRAKPQKQGKKRS